MNDSFNAEALPRHAETLVAWGVAWFKLHEDPRLHDWPLRLRLRNYLEGSHGSLHVSVSTSEENPASLACLVIPEVPKEAGRVHVADARQFLKLDDKLEVRLGFDAGNTSDNEWGLGERWHERRKALNQAWSEALANWNRDILDV